MDIGLETKIADTGSDSEIAGAFGDMMRAFEAFKDANDERLADIEKRMSADVVTGDKLDRIGEALDRQKARLDELTLKARRPQLGGADEAKSEVSGEHKQAFTAYVRKGEAGTLRDLESKALSVGSDPDGGFLVPDELERAVNRAV